MKVRNAFAGVAVLALLAGGAGTTLGADVTYERLLNPEPGNWLMNHRTYDSHQYSPLDEINKENVKDLKMAFSVPLMQLSAGAGTFASSLHGTPLVDDGIMYMTDGWGRVYRINLTRGDRALIDWIMDPETDPELATGLLNNRGVALYGDSVYSMSPDCAFIRTNKESGEVIFRVETQQNPAEYCSMAPLAINDKIIVGPGGGDGPMNGRLEARDPENGDLLWTFQTVKPDSYGEGAETGGAATWVTGSFDPDRNELVWGIGNPYPDFDPTVRPGDNLYSNSTVAVDADTGEYRWHFQYTPNDSWDFDEVGSQTLHTATIDGVERKVLSHFGRNGFFYNLDATNGAFLNGSKYVDKVTWTAGIDPKTGMPVEYDPGLQVQTYIPETRVMTSPFAADAEWVYCPYIEGGVNMYPTSLSEKTGLLYGLSIEGCNYNPAARPEDAKLLGAMTAIDPATGQVSGRTDFTSTGRGGALATAGGVVFGTTSNGDFFALDDTTLERLWNYNFGTSIDAPPITFAINGKQYVAIAVGPGGIILGFHDYAAKGSDPDAAKMLNFQPTSTMYFFAL